MKGGRDESRYNYYRERLDAHYHLQSFLRRFRCRGCSHGKGHRQIYRIRSSGRPCQEPGWAGVVVAALADRRQLDILRVIDVDGQRIFRNFDLKALSRPVCHKRSAPLLQRPHDRKHAYFKQGAGTPNICPSPCPQKANPPGSSRSFSFLRHLVQVPIHSVESA